MLPLLKAFEHLDSEQSRRATLILAGPIHAKYRKLIEAQIARVRDGSQVQLIVVDQFIEDREIQRYLHAADVVMATYQKHIGMSALLVRAAAARRPVLASDFGLVGELVARHKLGDCVDSRVPQAIAAGISRFLEHSPGDLFDEEEAGRFAAEHTAEKTARVIWDAIRQTEQC